jgi:hypothetical protein
MALTRAERSARWRAEHPDRALAYRESDRGREVARAATARWRAKHPKEPKPLPAPLTADQETEKLKAWHADYMRKWSAATEGYAACTDYPPPPKDNRCQKCRAHTKLHLDHDHETGAFRGWLCLKCNMGIGQLGDTHEGLQAALAYLDGELPWQSHPLPGVNGLLGFGA